MSQSLSRFRLERKFQIRIYIVMGFLILSTFILILQLSNLQILYGADNNILAKKFVSRQEFTIAPRGLVYDRNYPESANLLVRNINYVDFVIYPSKFAKLEDGIDFLKKFCSAMGRSCEEYEEFLEPKKWKESSRKNNYITLITRMNRKEHERLSIFHMISKYGDFITNHLRYYTMGPALAHVTGYVGLPTRHELDQKRALSYQMIGKGGIESFYDAEIRGRDGIRIKHRILDSEEQVMETEQGNNAVLTIDKKVQAAAYNSLIRSGLRGTVVAMKVSTGEILALVSQPTFDPNILSNGISEQRSLHIEQVNENEGFLNLALQAKFPPASTFKPMVAIAAMESPEKGDFTQNTEFYCPGFWKLKSSQPGVPPSVYACWEHRGHGVNSLIGGITHSCNVYFYQLGYKLGPTPIIQMAKEMGLNRVTGIDLPGEISGFVPDQRWKQLAWSSRWYDGDTVNLAIGQGFLEVTPIELAVLYSTIVNRGKVYRPFVLKEIRDPLTHRLVRKKLPELVKEIPISEESTDIVRRAMRSVVENGTGRYFLNQRFPPIAGKTGTAQTRSGIKGSNHAWFAGFAPYGAPVEEQIVVVVFLEYGMGGAATAIPVAGDVFQAALPDWIGIKPPVIKREQTETDAQLIPEKVTE